MDRVALQACLSYWPVDPCRAALVTDIAPVEYGIFNTTYCWLDLPFLRSLLNRHRESWRFQAGAVSSFLLFAPDHIRYSTRSKADEVPSCSPSQRESGYPEAVSKVWTRALIFISQCLSGARRTRVDRTLGQNQAHQSPKFFSYLRQQQHHHHVCTPPCSKAAACAAANV